MKGVHLLSNQPFLKALALGNKVEIDLTNPEIACLFRLEHSILSHQTILKAYVPAQISLEQLTATLKGLQSVSYTENKVRFLELVKSVLEFSLLQKTPSFYHAECQKMALNDWVRQRLIYEKDNTNCLRIYEKGSEEDNILTAIETRKMEDRGFSIIEYILEKERKGEGEKAIRSIVALLSKGEVYLVEHKEGISVPEIARRVIPQRELDVKGVKEFEDITLLYQTMQIDKIPASCELTDNPILALPRIPSRMWELIDGKRNCAEIYNILESEYGTRVTPDFIICFLIGLASLGYLKRFDEQEFLRNTDLRQEEWDYNVSIVQHSLVYSKLPFYVLLELTDRCNRFCLGCYKRQIPFNQDLPDEIFLQKIVEPIIQSGVGYVTLLGGEPLLRKGLTLEIVRRLKHNHIYSKLITNGDLLDRDTALRLGMLGLNKIELSIDGFSPDVNDFLRGKGTLGVIEKVLQQLKDAGIPEIGISVTVSSWNFDAVVNTIEGFLTKYPQVTKVYFSRFYRWPESGYDEGIRELTPEQLEKLKLKIVEWKHLFATRKRFEMAVLDVGMCSCGRTMAVITSQGQIKPCPFMSITGESLLNFSSFQELWEKSFRSLRAEPKAVCFARLSRERMQRL